jgi:hypothetical protein
MPHTRPIDLAMPLIMVTDKKVTVLYYMPGCGLWLIEAVFSGPEF